MKYVNHFHFVALSLVVLTVFSGCSTLPDVSRVIDDTPSERESVRIASAKGLLSPQKSQAIMERLRRSVPPTDILERHNAVLESVTESPLTKGNKVKLLIDGRATYAAMFDAIRHAKANINLETFTIADDEAGRKFSNLLLEKRAEGVEVNLIYDSVGSHATPAAFFQRLRDGGVRLVEFNPVNPLKARGHWSPEHPDHRKLLIVDGRLAITGGINITSNYSIRVSGGRSTTGASLPWRDTDVQVEGPAVAEFQKLFLATWQKQQGAKLDDPSYFPGLKEVGNALVRVVGSTPGQNNRITFTVYVAAITFAERSIHLTNAYLIPDDQILDAFTAAAKRGVDVKIIVPANSDSTIAVDAARYNYSELLKAGVKIYERRNAILHAKTAVIDGVWSTVGSTNLDFWSLLSDDEVNAVILSREFAGEMERVFAADLAASDQIQWEKWKKRPLWQKIKQSFAHLFCHLM
ncbi:cardiolipin synthase [Geomesophilobacter sediminis]|uniref:Cardiolipin synthase n=1 Tax=Geomesophilobacter sediminis TaxID=2798584 RepID=A0A8J7LY29_9BACT|nr:cardiolipin synthase [Geomesophilobacter sediminis]MBJ6724201.1 cardiolipin synthase [Geomesophilobacter sediminis]